MNSLDCGSSELRRPETYTTKCEDCGMLATCQARTRLQRKEKHKGSWQTSGPWLPVTSTVPLVLLFLYPPFFSSRDFCSARSARKCRGDWDSGGVNLLSVLVSLTGLLPPLASTFREEFCCPPSGLHKEILLL